MTINYSNLIPLPESITPKELGALYRFGFVTAFLRQESVMSLVKMEAELLLADAEMREEQEQHAKEG